MSEWYFFADSHSLPVDDLRRGSLPINPTPCKESQREENIKLIAI